ncbi:MAG: hypothetical protein EAZ70_04645 [Runella slithyformis]|nr:MAG: hypothetical protein EAY79_05005 [Runella slithyformis]TAE99721.1 MAG: hypothetical protein EAZ80_04545 [Runella slithyformis]TAF28643.1 MAG: hypothetical protein EAZ70_04645 [Runella slithyformis]TAF46650.1 MAG: hypothetical protein EAZ63_09200 [Runella slithyformis]TAF82359.1 MAG: hypothetical protein EAZ50_04145 [Runella slithyformis]
MFGGFWLEACAALPDNKKHERGRSRHLVGSLRTSILKAIISPRAKNSFYKQFKACQEIFVFLNPQMNPIS